jgi:D-psicose/D-tagatose/L-ribulose 3-epimerase
MAFGISMLLWGDDFRDESHMALFSKLRDIGYEGVEIPLFQGSPQDYKNLGRRLSELGLRKVGVSVCSPDNDPSSADPAIRTKASEHLRWALECCAAGGFELLCGPFSGALGGFPETVPSQDSGKRASDVLAKAAVAAEGYGQRIALE